MVREFDPLKDGFAILAEFPVYRYHLMYPTICSGFRGGRPTAYVLREWSLASFVGGRTELHVSMSYMEDVDGCIQGPGSVPACCAALTHGSYWHL